MRTIVPAKILTNQIAELEKYNSKTLNIVEVGSIRAHDVKYLLGDGFSTLYIARFCSIGANKHNFYSIDIKTDVAKQVLEKYKLSEWVNFVEKDAIDGLREVLPGAELDMVYLDANDEPTAALNEFKEAEKRMAKGGVIVIDDAAFAIDGADTDKVSLILPYLTENKRYHVRKDVMLIVKF